MLWIRRNLFWALFGLVGLLLAACGGFYLWSGIRRNSQVDEEINAAKTQLNRLLDARPSPTETNVSVARASLRQLEEAIGREQKYFTEVPYAPVQGVDFVTVLNSNVVYLQQLAKKSSVKLPDGQFAFSFEEQMNKARFADGSFPVLAEQLGEIGLLVSKLFEANINALVDLKRSKTPDDVGGSPHCHGLPREVKEDVGMVVCPYHVTFYAFSTELGRVFENLCNAEKFMAVKIMVLNHEVDKTRLEPPGSREPGSSVRPESPPPRRRPPVRPGAPPPNPRRPPTRGFAPPPPAPPGEGGGLATAELFEELCKVTLAIDVIKPAPPPPSQPPDRPRGRPPGPR